MKDLVLAARTVFRGDIINEAKTKIAYHKSSAEEDIAVCLTCKQPKCFGEERCFRKRKSKLERGEIE